MLTTPARTTGPPALGVTPPLTSHAAAPCTVASMRYGAFLVALRLHPDRRRRAGDRLRSTHYRLRRRRSPYGCRDTYIILISCRIYAMVSCVGGHARRARGDEYRGLKGSNLYRTN